jgi:hypothetical protein
MNYSQGAHSPTKSFKISCRSIGSLIGGRAILKLFVLWGVLGRSTLTISVVVDV